ncbi:MAG: hypothetical protein WCO66_03260 [Candidatus Absconditabacteria bacterium]
MGIEDFAPIGSVPGIQPMIQNTPDVFSETGNINNKLNNEPSDISGRQIIGKIGLGLGIGGIITAVLFMITTFVGGMFSSAMSGAGTAGTTSNPILSIILLFIGFISTFIGNLAVAGIYNLFFSRKYINGSKIYGLLLLTNGLLFFIFAPIYLIFSSQVQILFIVLGFHIVFSIFISACQTEFSANPNYSGSSLIGNTIGFALAIVTYCVIYKQSLLDGAEKQTYLLMLLPTILGYTLIPLGASIREKIYYKSYEMGNNAFYLSSVDEREELSPEESEKAEESEINIEG